MKNKYYSYGIIPIYKNGADIFVCAVLNIKSKEWGLPKGSPEKDETPFETAKRELKEETGISEFKIFGGKTFVENYSFEQDGQTYQKENTYYVATVDEMRISENIDSFEMKWINIKESNSFFKFENIKKVLSDVEAYLNKFPFINEYRSRSGETCLFEYYESDSIEHLPKEKLSQVQITAFHKDKLLIVNNANKFNMYSLVGGGIEIGEHPEHCLVRELKEESNMRPVEFKLIGYQICKNLSNAEKPDEYQLRYFAKVEPIGPFTPDCDPDGDVTELLEIDPYDYKKYFDLVAIATSTAIVTEIITFRFLKDFKISNHESDILSILWQFLWVAIIGVVALSFLFSFINSPDVLISANRPLQVIVLILLSAVSSWWLLPKLHKASQNTNCLNISKIASMRIFVITIGAMLVANWILLPATSIGLFVLLNILLILISNFILFYFDKSRVKNFAKS